MGKQIDLVYWGIEYTIEYEDTPITHQQAWRPFGNGIWVYDRIKNTLGRVCIGFSHELPYHYNETTWNPKGRYYKVLASSKPLWLWWGQGCRELNWGDMNVALPKL